VSGGMRTPERRASEVMRSPFPVADAGLPLERPLPLLARESTAVLVRRDGAPAGIVTRNDVLRHVAGIR
jgi:cystathionine beta-synthase